MSKLFDGPLTVAPGLDPAVAANIDENPYRADFPLLANSPGLAFLDSAATAQRPECVLEAQKVFYETMNANPLRGLYGLSIEATEEINEARATVARFIGADDPREVIFTRNTSESLNLAARSLGDLLLKPGDQVVISVMEHHSNLIPWQQVCAEKGAELVYLYPNDEGLLTPEEIEAKIGPKTRIVSIAHVSNVLGVENPVHAIADRAHEMGAVCVVDAAQSAPHIKIDVKELGCDLLAFSAHKVFGPLGIGVLWGKMALLEKMPPFLTGGEMIDSVTETEAVWAPVPEKFEAGTQDAAGIAATAVALDYVDEVGLDAIEAREDALVAELDARLRAIPGVTVYGPTDATKRHGVVAFNLEGVHPHDVASLLDSKDVCIRAGHHCAQPLLTYLGCDSTNRASVAFYNDRSDIDQLVDGIEFVRGIFHGSC
ncbi:SufS family cysteine desulfurase [Olsenella sp. YH-ols2217]|uniref:Cysteine desulfurase n=1 Tax=Kribbibacterium absianum TaxID=3044210 RepID=A0ABT6ZI45_9ACTN|nr:MULTISPECIES: SufS family cysteine desulfurase [unclassified Olsenella]MDJ1121071.1 SufS family cysteine desulfurase [Olsenella sp. YH-ols2216]MDJ1128562.1 SufS family cysteine desulfurase [Olsenella sp. YH-ols2217]